jgi:Domain of unknown function (DUF5666)
LAGRIFVLTGRCPNLRFVVQGTVTLTNDDTKFRKGSCGNLENGDDVRVKGQRQADGTVEAREVERRDDDDND